MRWDAQPGDHGGEPGAWREFESDRGRGRDSFDLLDDDRAGDDFDDFGRRGGGAGQRSTSPSYGNGIAARDRAATLAGGDTRRAPPASALAAAGAGRARAASSATQGLGASAYVPKPWDAPSSGAGGRARSGTAGSGGLDLRPVEADFERVLSMSKHGGDGEVGAASGIGAPSPSGGRSRSGTGGGLGTAVALFDFPGVEVRPLFLSLSQPLHQYVLTMLLVSARSRPTSPSRRATPSRSSPWTTRSGGRAACACARA